MSSVLNANFIRSVTRRVDDCSNPIQLRGYLNRYRDYVFTPEIQRVFLDRIEFFKEEYKYDCLFTDACEELEEDLR